MTQSKKEMAETSPTRKKQPTAAERKLYMQSLERQQKRFAETQMHLNKFVMLQKRQDKFL